MVEYQQKDKYNINDLLDIVRLLRSEGGCPWDREQTHESIRSDFIEETCEAVEAIDLKDTALLREELGETNVSLSVMAERVERGYYDNELDGGDTRFQNAFNAALLRNGNSTAIWKSDAPSTQ